MAEEKKCREFRELLSPYMEKELNDSEMDRLSRHLEECQDCKRELDLLQKTVGILKDLPQEPPPAEIIEGVKEVIYRRPAWISWWETMKGSNWTRPLAQAAAVVIVVASIIIVQQRYPGLEKEGARITRPRLIPREPEAKKPSVTDETAPAIVSEKAPVAEKEPRPEKDEHAPFETKVSRPLLKADREAVPETETSKVKDVGFMAPPAVQKEPASEKTLPTESPPMEAAAGKKSIPEPTLKPEKNAAAVAESGLVEEATSPEPSAMLEETPAVGPSKKAQDKILEPAVPPTETAVRKKVTPPEVEEAKRAPAVSALVSESLAEGEAAVDAALPTIDSESGRQDRKIEEKFRIMKEKEPDRQETLFGGKEKRGEEPEIRLPGMLDRLTPGEDSKMMEDVRSKGVARLKGRTLQARSRKPLPTTPGPEDAYFQKAAADLIILIRAPKDYDYLASLPGHIEKFGGRIENIGPLKKSVYQQSADLLSRTERALPFSGSSITLALPANRTEGFLRSVAGKTPLKILRRQENSGFRASESRFYIIQLHVWQPL